MADPVKQCPKCQSELDPSAALCPQCGEPVAGSPAEELLGQTLLGHYLVEKVLGQGGMSLVYRGKHVLTEQAVAIKILPPELAVHAALKARFLEEARALAKLEHPNIVRLYNFGEDRGRLCLIMQMVDGETFERQIFDRGHIEPAEAIRVTLEVLKAMEYAHESGIVHRDIKPSNVLVRPGPTPERGGDVYVMDFGIARVTQTSQRLTETGQTMGTVRYMSPEQVRGQIVDHRSDLYSLGITLYEGLCGETPFEGDTHFDVMSKHLQQPPQPPSERGVALSPGVEAVLLNSLRKDPAQRYQSAKAMRLALEAALGGQLPSTEKGTVQTPIAADVTARLKPDLPASQPPSPGAASANPTGLAKILEPSDSMIRVPKKRILPIALVIAALGATGDAVAFIMLRGSSSEGQKNTGNPPIARVDGGRKAPRLPRDWTKLHPALANRVPKSNDKIDDPPLRVIVDSQVSDRAKLPTLEALRQELVDTERAFAEYLTKISVTERPARVPLTIAFVPHAVIQNKVEFKTQAVTRAIDIYVSPAATLFLATDGERSIAEALSFNLPFHICHGLHDDEATAIPDCTGKAKAFIAWWQKSRPK